MGTPKNIAKQLATRYKIEVKQPRYSKDGKWYHNLKKFPAAFLDQNGYVIFATKDEYINCRYLQFAKDVHVVGDGISSIPRYKKYKEQTLSFDDRASIIEGGIREIYLEQRQRNPKLKELAIRKMGNKCQICNFSFFSQYGKIGKGYIELHHKNPLSDSSGERQTTIDEIALVCSNCHRMLHQHGKNPLDIEDLRKMLIEQNVAFGAFGVFEDKP